MTRKEIDVVKNLRILDNLNPEMDADMVIKAIKEHEEIELTRNFYPTPPEVVVGRKFLLSEYGKDPEEWIYWKGGTLLRFGEVDDEVMEYYASELPKALEALLLPGYIFYDESGVYPRVTERASFAEGGYSLFVRKRQTQVE